MDGLIFTGSLFAAGEGRSDKKSVKRKLVGKVGRNVKIHHCWKN